MGLFDFLLSKQQLRDRAASRIALESGLFQKCPVCHGITEAKNPGAYLEATRALVNRKIAEHHSDTQLFEADAEEVLATINKVREQLPHHCTCESI